MLGGKASLFHGNAVWQLWELARVFGWFHCGSEGKQNIRHSFVWCDICVEQMGGCSNYIFLYLVFVSDWM